MRARRLLATLAALAAAAAAIATTAAPAQADTTLCDQYATSTLQGGAYIVQNNRWGTGSTQCISVSGNGFRVTQQDGVNPTNGAPTAYPSVYWGCHYGNCTPGFSPIPVTSSQFTDLSTGVAMSYPSGGNWDAAYDIWFDPTARTNGQNTGAEIMVWLNHSGPPQPVGSKIATVTLAGGTWDVWEGNIGWNVISYVRTSGTGSISFPVSTFLNDAVSRGYASRSWYLTSVQAGFEPWSGGAGLALSGFSVTHGSTPPTTPPSTPPATTPPATTPPATTPPTTTPASPPTTTPPAAGSRCAAGFRVTQSWPGGFTAEVTVTNTGSAATHNWKATWNWPGAQTVQNMWNAVLGHTGNSQTATSVNYNSSLAPGSITTFGLQGTGPAVAPAVACSVG